jgi:hypothetical protein
MLHRWQAARVTLLGLYRPPGVGAWRRSRPALSANCLRSGHTRDTNCTPAMQLFQCFPDPDPDPDPDALMQH